MAYQYFVAVAEPASDGGFGIFFPDLPGCTSGGDTLPEAITNAGEALALHIAGMVEDGEDLPKARGFHDFGPEDFDDASEDLTLIAVRVPAPPEPEAAERINVTFNPRLLARIDKRAKSDGLTRSAFLALAARRALERA